MSEVLDLKHKARSTGGRQDSGRFEYQEKGGKRKSGWIRWLIVMIVAVALTTAGIKASDSLFGNKAKNNSLCPAEMVFIPGSTGGFCLDKYEDAAGNGCSFKDPANQDQTRTNLENQSCQPASQAGLIPWRYISQNQAAVACAKAGKRLPTNEEWLAAALATPDKNSNWGADDCQVANNWVKQPGPAGSGKNCVSGAGAYDLIGNVWEWVEGTVEDGKYQGNALPDDGYIKGVNSLAMPTDTNSDQADPNYYDDYFWIKKTGSRGIARGGYWGNNDQAGQYSVYLVTPPSEAGTGTGFRCAK
ncbi:MAG: SUMF1/EgtB/PvdO family nonheme iron enzyme [Patescibacteria group bacterium]|nr:SUMF1/EgtB/PvdO family nonheme iron enzyme [Patescibacteria group bacterium]